MRISDWSSDVCSSDLSARTRTPVAPEGWALGANLGATGGLAGAIQHAPDGGLNGRPSRRQKSDSQAIGLGNFSLERAFQKFAANGDAYDSRGHQGCARRSMETRG